MEYLDQVLSSAAVMSATKALINAVQEEKEAITLRKRRERDLEDAIAEAQMIASDHVAFLEAFLRDHSNRLTAESAHLDAKD